MEVSWYPSNKGDKFPCTKFKYCCNVMSLLDFSFIRAFHDFPDLKKAARPQVSTLKFLHSPLSAPGSCPSSLLIILKIPLIILCDSVTCILLWV